ncbi:MULTISPECIES: hypothetical protein [unclassified Mycoplasma]|uniref:hypothetical protein n=1 Tax=unclassified Mycoplasma TaxID=2683645 RepID=UPI00211CB2DC|nr:MULTISPECIES: hypothetical protein [unclassified Mycoplasma]UUM19847.1 hypothetical protein NPA11_00180 [Mycoplasma sp. 1578d]UUM24831.1 hypothetical protein NPA12_00180 [Mycoplasma sp. 3686d]
MQNISKNQAITLLNKFNQIAKEIGFVYSLNYSTYCNILKDNDNFDKLSINLYLQDFIKLVACDHYQIKYVTQNLDNNPLPKIIIDQKEIELNLIIHSNSKIINSSKIKKQIKLISKSNQPYLFDQLLSKLQTNNIDNLCWLTFQNQTLEIKEIKNVNLKYYDVIKVNDNLFLPIHDYFKKER